MDLVKLTEDLVKSIVLNEDSVSVKEFPTEEENVTLIQVMVAEEDMGRVVGKDGNAAKALRTLVQTAASLDNNDKFIKIDIDKF
ncbi:MAG: KH domain-containing protein [Bacilli bacterium]|nr:KH domain-containing protein [Bacilli bacterium]